MYNELFSRNIGIVSEKEQGLIKNIKVLILGAGGMGGSCAEALVRAGAMNITIIDPDTFDKSNINRQVGSNIKTVGKYKVFVLKKMFLNINPQLNIKVINKSVLDVKNIESIVMEHDYLVNGMDDIIPSIIVERIAKKYNKTIVDAWLTPYASVFVMKPNDPHWEKFLNLKIKNSPAEISNEDKYILLKKEIQYTFSHFTPYKHIAKKKVINVIKGIEKRPSFIIVTWLSGLLMANEILKLAMNKKTIDYKGVFFDHYEYRICQGKAK